MSCSCIDSVYLCSVLFYPTSLPTSSTAPTSIFKVDLDGTNSREIMQVTPTQGRILSGDNRNTICWNNWCKYWWIITFTKPVK